MSPPDDSDKSLLTNQSFNQALTEGATDLGLALTPAQLDLFSRHYAFLLGHRAHGVTAITNPLGAAIKHFLDSLTALLIRDLRPGERVADIGSGAGFPGLVLAVARPQASYLLIESNLRRAALLRELIAALKLRNASVIAERAEALGRETGYRRLQPAIPPEGSATHHREAYDLVVARALAPMPVLLEYCLPLVKVGGDCLALKGPAGQAELRRSQRALDLLGGQVTATRALSLPRGMGDRLLVLVSKVSPTPDRYPRRPGIPAKRPL